MIPAKNRPARTTIELNVNNAVIRRHQGVRTLVSWIAV